MSKLTPRRGIPKLIADVRRRAKQRGMSPQELADYCMLDYGACHRLLGKNHQTNLKKKTEGALRLFMEMTDPSKLDTAGIDKNPAGNVVDPLEDLKGTEDQLEMDLDPVDVRTPSKQIVDAVMEEVDKLLPLSPPKWRHIHVRVINAVDDGMEAQCEASSELIESLSNGFEERIGAQIAQNKKLEEELADKDAQIIAFQQAGTAQFRLGKDVAAMTDHERGALQGLLVKTESENVNLRAALKSLSNTL
jgi:hypothetical protein